MSDAWQQQTWNSCERSLSKNIFKTHCTNEQLMVGIITQSVGIYKSLSEHVRIIQRYCSLGIILGQIRGEPLPRCFYRNDDRSHPIQRTSALHRSMAKPLRAVRATSATASADEEKKWETFEHKGFQIYPADAPKSLKHD